MWAVCNGGEDMIFVTLNLCVKARKAVQLNVKACVKTVFDCVLCRNTTAVDWSPLVICKQALPLAVCLAQCQEVSQRHWIWFTQRSPKGTVFRFFSLLHHFCIINLYIVIFDTSSCAVQCTEIETLSSSFVVNALLSLMVLFCRFFGCGLPFPAKLEGCRVLDLGSGSGRDCYAFSKLVGPSGRVTGIDMTEELVITHACTHTCLTLDFCALYSFYSSLLRLLCLVSTLSITNRSLAIRSPTSPLSRGTWRSSVKLAYRMTQWMLCCRFKASLWDLRSASELCGLLL